MKSRSVVDVRFRVNEIGISTEYRAESGDWRMIQLSYFKEYYRPCFGRVTYTFIDTSRQIREMKEEILARQKPFDVCFWP